MTDEQLNRIANQLLGDLDAADLLMCPSRQETEQQKLQLIADAFEQVAALAVGGYIDRQKATLELLTPDAT